MSDTFTKVLCSNHGCTSNGKRSAAVVGHSLTAPENERDYTVVCSRCDARSSKSATESEAIKSWEAMDYSHSYPCNCEITGDLGAESLVLILPACPSCGRNGVERFTRHTEPGWTLLPEYRSLDGKSGKEQENRDNNIAYFNIGCKHCGLITPTQSSMLEAILVWCKFKRN